MKKLLKVVLPPFIGFSLYFIGVRYSPDYFDLTIGQIGSGTVAGFMAFYKYALPLLFFVAILTQLLIVMPVWNKMVRSGTSTRIWTSVTFIIICLLFAGAISYLIWDRTTGVNHLIKTFVFFSAIQLIYWAINLFVLWGIE
jgi:hypothetical protein